MSIRKLFYLLLFCMGLTSCSKDKRGPSEPTTKVVLTVKLGIGVEGNLPQGTHEYPAGTEVVYNFAPASGYSGVVVELDKVSTKASGSFVIDGAREISVVADSAFTLPAKAEPTKTDIVRYMVATDSVSAASAYKKYTDNLEALFAAEPGQAMSLALAAQRKAFEETPDDVREKAEALLAGKLYGPSSAASSVTANASSTGTSVIYVNGILNPIDAPAVARKGLETIAKDRGLTGMVEVYNFYNASGWYESTDRQRCLMKAIIRGSLTTAATCYASDAVVDFAEMRGQIQDVLDKSGKRDVANEAKALSKIVRQERDRGRSVILVGHSQGTLMVQQALAELANPDDCITAISVAGLLGIDSWKPLASPNLDGFVIAGNKAQDIVLVYGKNDFAKKETNLSKLADGRLEGIYTSDLGLTSATRWFIESVRLHSMPESYLAGTESRKLLGDMIETMTKNLQSRPHCSIAPGLRLYAAEGSLNSQGHAVAPSYLWTVDPRPTGKDSLIGEIKTAAGKRLAILDIAESPATGELLAVASDSIYSVDKATGTATFVKRFRDIGEGIPLVDVNALAFDNQGRLYAGSSKSAGAVGFERSDFKEFFRAYYTSDDGSANTMTSSGDLAVSPAGKLYGVGQNRDSVNYLTIADNTYQVYYLIPVKTGSPIGFKKVWGLSFVGNTLLGFTTDPTGSRGSLLALDVVTGKGTEIRKLGFNAFGAARKSRRF